MNFSSGRPCASSQRRCSWKIALAERSPEQWSAKSRLLRAREKSWLKRERPLVGGNGRIDLPVVLEDIPEVVVRLHQIRPQLDRPLVGRDGGAQAALHGVGDARSGDEWEFRPALWLVLFIGNGKTGAVFNIPKEFVRQRLCTGITSFP